MPSATETVAYLGLEAMSLPEHFCCPVLRVQSDRMREKLQF